MNFGKPTYYQMLARLAELYDPQGEHIWVHDIYFSHTAGRAYISHVSVRNALRKFAKEGIVRVRKLPEMPRLGYWGNVLFSPNSEHPLMKASIDSLVKRRKESEELLVAESLEFWYRNIDVL